MEIDFLRHFGIPEKQVSILKSAYGYSLLPLQEKAIRQGGLLNGQNCLICAPTSSGKTFLAEILFLFHALSVRKVVLLVPTKALANQRYAEWKERYADLGYEILLSTRDHPFNDRRILEGRFHLAVVIYEKMRSLLAMDDAWLSSLGACVVDEAHYLFHTTRGPDLELLLTRLRSEPGLQIVGLSAVLSDERVAHWLKAQYIAETQRPVELRQGVLCQGEFVYQEFNSKKQGKESFPFDEQEDDGLAMLEAARYFASRNESTLLFWPRRDQCYTAARKLAQEHNPHSDVDLTPVMALEPSSMRDFLLELLPRRIAIHTSDLTTEEREVVETLAKAGEVKLICATSTLAEGLNFPVVNVLTTQRIYSTRPGENGSFNAPAPMMIQQDQLLNMTGRAGRLNLSDFGRGIIVTCSQGDVDGLLNHYDTSQPPEQTPLLSRLSFNQVVLKAIGSRKGIPTEICAQFLQDTYTGHKNIWPDRLENQLEQSLESLQEGELASQEGGRWYPTPLGELVCKSGLSERSARRINHYVKQQLLEEPHPLDILLLVSLLDELQESYIFVSRSQIQEHTWRAEILRYAQEYHVALCPNNHDLLNNPVMIRPEHHRAFKRTALVFEWIQGMDVLELERSYNLYSGAITRLCEEAGWLIGCMADAAAAHALPCAQTKSLFRLQERVIYGLPDEGLGWSSYLRKRRLTRRNVLKLLEHGLQKPGDIHPEDKDFITTFVSPASVEALYKSIVSEKERTSEPPVEDPGDCPNLLEFDKARPNRISLNGTPVDLTKMQSELLRCLARNEAVCVNYETIYSEVWKGSNGDRKLLMQLKKKLTERIRENTGTLSPELIETITGEGLILNARVKWE